MTSSEIIGESKASAFLVATFEARVALHQGRRLPGIGINAIRPKPKAFEIHRTDEEDIVDHKLEENSYEDEPAVYPSDETIIPPLEFATRHRGRVLYGCEETGSTVEVLSNGAVGLLPFETIVLEMAMQADTPLTIL